MIADAFGSTEPTVLCADFRLPVDPRDPSDQDLAVKVK
ncbi:hypothetical protein ACVWZD_003043 [Streptomyces sp. TE3672]